MTRYRSDVLVCSVCGAKSTHYVLKSTNTFGGGPDLDGRPGEDMRDTIGKWLQECPVCGVVAPNLQKESPVTVQWLKEKHYRKCDGLRFASNVAKRFYRHYKIMTFAGDNKAVFNAIHCAAWACDDVGDRKNARHCRLLALDKLEKLMEESDHTEELWVVKADLLRRTEQFEKVIELKDSISLSDNYLNQLLSFEAEKAQENDSDCYCTDDVEDSYYEISADNPSMSDDEWAEFLEQLQF